MFLLQSNFNSLVPSKEKHVLTEYSHSTKFEVSRKLRSLVLRSPSATFPPLPNLRPCLSFFFLAVRTLLNRNSTLMGN